MKLTQKFLACLAYCQHFVEKKDDHGQNITGVCIEYAIDSNNFNIISTDGKTLAMYETPNFIPTKKVVLHFDQIKVLLQKAKQNPNGEIEFNDELCTVKLSDGNAFLFKHKGANFVSYRRVLPRENRTIELTKPIGFNIEFFERIGKGINSAKPFLSHPVSQKIGVFKFGLAHEALVVDINLQELTFKTLIMPCRL